VRRKTGFERLEETALLIEHARRSRDKTNLRDEQAPLQSAGAAGYGMQDNALFVEIGPLHSTTITGIDDLLETMRT
jgi:hypothetical protein